VQHVAGYERQRRHATLVAVTLDLATSLTDQAINLFDRLIGTMFRKADQRHARAFQADGRAINEKVRLYARVGAALIAARDNKQDAFDAITAESPGTASSRPSRRPRRWRVRKSSMPTRCSARSMPASAVGLQLSSMHSSSRVCRLRRR
jgi:hypothetical protein